MIVPDDDRFERVLAEAIREGAPDAAPGALHHRVAASTAVARTGAVAVTPGRARASGWLLGAAAAASVLLVGVLLIPRATPAPGATPPGSTLGATALGSPVVSSFPDPTPSPISALPESIVHPGMVQFGDLLTPTVAWVQNTDGHLFLTHSGGAAWRQVDPPRFDPERVAGGWFADYDHGWIAVVDREGGTEIHLWRTVDAGVTWVPSAIPDPNILFAGLMFIDTSDGVLIAQHAGDDPRPTLRWTHDGGVTWSDPIDLVAATGLPTAGPIDFFDPSHGLMTDQELLVTSDGGHSWAPPKSNDPGVVSYAFTPRHGLPSIVSATTAFVVVAWSNPEGKVALRTILETDDAGASWTTRFTDEVGRKWAFLDAAHWIATDGLQVWTTADAGATFEVAPSTGLPVVLDSAYLDFVDPLHGWAEATGGEPCKGYGCLRISELYKTADGGRTWALVGSCEDGSEPRLGCPTPRPS